MDSCNNNCVFILLLLLTLLINHLCLCKASDQVLCISSEQQALLNFKNHLLDPSSRLASWSKDTNCCNWTSIVCDDVTGHILQLHLKTSPPSYYYYGNHMAGFGGEIHPSILGLNHLRYLDLSGNDFGGMQIPSFLGSMKSLTYLNLSYARFSGSIPHQIAKLSSLIYLDLGGNSFTGPIPHQIGNLSSLLYLNLDGGYHYDDMDGISLFPENLQWLSSLSSLKYLQLSDVNLSNAFDWLHVLQSIASLTELHLTRCTLHHDFDPAIVTNFTSLAILELSNSYDFGASSFPKWIFQLKNLVSLKLSNNNLQGSIPNGIQNLTLIEDLDLSYNLFNSSIPVWLYSLNHLKSLNLHKNNLHGTISYAIGNLTSLVTVALSNNQLEGPIPSSLRNLCSLRSVSFSNIKCNRQVSKILGIISGCASHSLESLSVFSSKLYGHLTNQIGIFKNLVYLDLSDNSIQGEIPKSLRNLTSLNHLYLDDNQFSGNPFEVIQSLVTIQELGISNNLFQGEVNEDHLANLTKLYGISASRNKLNLKVGPNWSPPFKNLKFLEMAFWNLGPQFPSWVHSLKGLEMLSIPNNNISDSIPKWVWDAFPNAFYFNFSNNYIHGELSYTMKNPLNVSSIYLASNHLSGHLPYISSNVVGLDLSNNWFSGSMTSFMCQGKVKHMRLIDLNLASNNLSGEIPDCWVMWPNLMFVKFDNNHLSGNLPQSLGSLPWLGSLRLRNNTLLGKFPICLKNNTRLVFLDLSENHLSGIIPLWVGHVFLNLKVFLLRSNNFIGKIPNQICSLNSIQILDLAQNNLTRQIPKCINNLTAMLIKNNSLETYIWSQVNRSRYSITDVLLTLKGRHDDYTFPGLITSIDFSDNKLSGEIPCKMTSLMGLQFLNLSNNLLHGEIPQSIGNMGSLESMDFSKNKLSGTQLQTFEADSFVGNDLCGPPLLNKCIDLDDIPNNGHNDKDTHGNGINWFYVSMSLGFVSGFWIVVGPLLYNRSWRLGLHAWLHYSDALSSVIPTRSQANTGCDDFFSSPIALNVYRHGWTLWIRKKKFLSQNKWFCIIRYCGSAVQIFPSSAWSLRSHSFDLCFVARAALHWIYLFSRERRLQMVQIGIVGFKKNSLFARSFGKTQTDRDVVLQDIGVFLQLFEKVFYFICHADVFFSFFFWPGYLELNCYAL
ncbi:receptor-like protein EIX2 [Prosopis cineraria]|uniref:receptor-like protein EIX2 n=1 Tax=Prosopis cineraria TaxID=364024 RepID=UPI00240EAD4C|nr:receptor-like protein EIX2 [Prosopis cineraria]